MTEAQLKKLIEDTLEIPVYTGADSITYPSATLEVDSQPAGLYGEGSVLHRLSDATINLWFKDKATRDSATTTLDAALQNIFGLTVGEIETYYDTTAKKFRAVFPLEFIPLDTSEPEPEPEPDPDPEPDPEPEPDPDPEPTPDPDPTPEPDPEPTPDPDPTP